MGNIRGSQYSSQLTPELHEDLPERYKGARSGYIASGDWPSSKPISQRGAAMPPG